MRPVEQQTILITGATDGLGRAVANNAALGIDPVRRITQDGLEATFQVDYLAPFMLSHLLEPLLKASAPSRIVNVASAGQASISFDDVMLERSYDGTRAYCQAKLAEIMLTFDHAANLAGTDVTVNCVHPAFNMPTKIVTHMFTPDSEIADGVTSVLRLITDPGLEHVTGCYFDQTQKAHAHEQAYDERARARVREIAERLTGVTATAPDSSSQPAPLRAQIGQTADASRWRAGP